MTGGSQVQVSTVKDKPKVKSAVSKSSLPGRGSVDGLTIQCGANTRLQDWFAEWLVCAGPQKCHHGR